MQHSTYQHNNQFLLMGVTIFASITAAVIISTLLIMSLMKGEIASALTSNVQNSTPVAQNTSACTVPANESAPTEESAAMTSDDSAVAFTSGVKPLHYMPTSVSNSFNTSNTTNTTNNVSNTEVKNKKTTVNISDSFNKDSYNDNSKNPVIVKDNTVTVNSNNGNAVNSGNTLNHNSNNTTTTQTTNNTALNSNNTTTTVVSNVVETHLLSDNTVVAL